MYDIDRAIRRLELAQRIDELQRQKAATAEQGLSVDAIATSETNAGAEAIPAPAVPAPAPAEAVIAPPQSAAPGRASVGPQPAPKFELAAPPSAAPPSAAPPSVPAPSVPAPTVVTASAATPAAAAPAVVVTQAAPPAGPVTLTPDAGTPLPVRDKAARAEAARQAAPAPAPAAASSLDAPTGQDETGEALIGAALLAEKVPQESVGAKRWAEALEEHLARTTPAETGPATPVAGVQGPDTAAAAPGHEQEEPETPRSPLPRAVAPMPLANWATPPGGPDSEPGVPVAPLSRGTSERPRPSASDLLPRAVVPVTNASRAQPARHAVDGHGPGSHKAWVEGLGAEQLQRNAPSVPATAAATKHAEMPAEVPAEDAPRHTAAQQPPMAQADAPLEPVESIEGAPEPLATEGEDSDPAEPTTDGSGLTAATIIADLLRHGNRSLLR